MKKKIPTLFLLGVGLTGAYLLTTHPIMSAPTEETLLVDEGKPANSYNQNQEWKRPSSEEIKQRLTSLQYRVTQMEGTEPPFKNAYWDNKKEGIYVDVVSGEPLFSSREKFKSGTGWPSFYAPLERGNITERTDRTLWIERTEVRSSHGDSHLGHVFDDGPQPTGLRYCINSAALRFIPKEDLEREGYGEYLSHFSGDVAAMQDKKLQ